MNNPVLLDSSAWFALAEGEPGAEEVEAFLAQAWDGQIVIHASFVTLVELEYIRTHEQGAMAADKLLAWAKEQPVQWHHSDEALCSEAAKLKASYKLSFADAFVAATAKQLGAVLVHKDPEFNAVSSVVNQRMLPPKGAAGAASAS